VAGPQLGVRVTHLRDQHVDQPAEERLGQAQVVRVAHRAAHDLAQDVAAPLVGGQHAVGDEKRHRARVVGDHARRDVCRVHRAAVVPPGEAADFLQERLKEIRVVVRQRLLHDRRDALEPHARVDRGRRQRDQAPVGLAVELHEDVVPDLDVPIARARHASADRLRTRQVRAAEVVDLRAPPAGTGIAHRPEVVVLPELGDARRRQHPQPEPVGLVVAGHAVLAGEHRREQPFGRQLPDAGQQLPGQPDRLLLEVVAEGEVPQHLEERVVPQRGPHVLEVVVLAADPHALLGGCRAPVVAPVAAEEDVLELVHPRVGEQQRGVVGRNER
jgi:hypothetical protein